MRKIRILVADDHRMLRDGLRRLIESEPDMEIVGDATDGAEAIARAGALLPDLVLMDISMQSMNGIETTRRLRAAHPAIKVVALTMHENRSYLREMLDVGVSGYVVKRAAADELVRAIRAVIGGGMHIDPRITAKLVDTAVSHPGANQDAADESRLTRREADTLRLIAVGYSNKEVAAQLDLSVKTVETYKARAMEKLGLRTRVDIVRLGSELGWLQPANEPHAPASR